MKEGFKVENIKEENATFIIVSNYTSTNEVKNWYFQEGSHIHFDSNDVGIWKIKKLK